MRLVIAKFNRLWSFMFILVLLFPSLSYAERGDLILWWRGNVLDKAVIDNSIDLFGIDDVADSIYDVRMFSIRYETIDEFGNETEATGLVAIPIGASEVPIACFHNGTETNRDEAPSRSFLGTSNGIFSLLMASFAGAGYLGVAPDYLGLGGGPGLHPYLHVESQSSAAIDAIRAVKNLVASLDNLDGTTVGDDLFLFGYSQGGHATVGTHRAIEENLSDEFSLVATAAGAGPFDLDGVQIKRSLDNPSENTPLYFAYVGYSMGRIYNLESDLSTLFKPPYDAMIPSLFDGSKTVQEIVAALPSQFDLDQLLYETTFEGLVEAYPDLIAALKENSLDEWVPEKPILFLYADADKDVSPENTHIAHRFMISENAPVRKQRVGTNRDHDTALIDTVVKIRLYFDSFYEEAASSYGIWQKSTDNFSLGQILVGNFITGPNSDPNFDRVDNVTCYAFGMDPFLANKDVLPQVRLNDSGFLELTVVSRVNDSALSVVGQVTHTPLMPDSWSSAAAHIQVNSKMYMGDGFQQTVYTSTTLFDPQDLQFIRALIELETD
ncbi:MAG: lipase family protein [Verrucomicrobiota bacterium]